MLECWEWVLDSTFKPKFQSLLCKELAGTDISLFPQLSEWKGQLMSQNCQMPASARLTLGAPWNTGFLSQHLSSLPNKTSVIIWKLYDTITSCQIVSNTHAMPKINTKPNFFLGHIFQKLSLQFFSTFILFQKQNKQKLKQKKFTGSAAFKNSDLIRNFLP